MKKQETPLMRQYYAFKSKYPGALLLFRVGDFYETFGEDAITASKILNITLTKRGNGSATEIELAGFPHHALDNYLPKLVRAGQRVAICDQLEDPKFAKGIVKRGVTELVTPGVTLSDNVLNAKQNNFLAAVHIEPKQNQCGVAFLDVSTGEFYAAQGNLQYAEKLLQSFQPAEVLFAKPQKNIFYDTFGDEWNVYGLDDWAFQFNFTYEKLTQHFQTTTLKGFGIEEMQLGVIAAGVILYYLAETEHHDLRHITSIARIEEERYVWLDRFSIRNLEMIFPQHEGGVPLIDILDHTITPMGGRLMRKWVVMPLKNKAKIEERLAIVKTFTEQEETAAGLSAALKHIGDLERLVSKVATKRINPRELNQLRYALEHLAPLRELLRLSQTEALQKLATQLNLCEFLLEKIKKELQTEVGVVSNQGNIINDGVDEQLDDYRKVINSGKDYLLQIQQRETQRTAIPSLKISFNKVFGYYLEVTNAHKNKVPNDWIRKQTLTGAERYITPELKQYEEKILTAEEKVIAIEQRIFNELVAAAADFIPALQQNAKVLSIIDCLLSLAKVAVKNNYVMPSITEENLIDIKQGRHPVIEQQLPLGEQYVPNDVYLDNETQQILIITGPNMAGKSALLRQTALIVLMAQIGSFVPAESATIGLIDKVFTRVGASDNLSKGESTFMVEMTETAGILNNLSDRSLVLMDEIGRGTSTYDGISIAWSIVEYLHNHPKYKAKTLFATHYHELNTLADDFKRIKNFNVSVKQAGDKMVFLRKLQPGGSEHSFGIYVAQMAGIPPVVIQRANEILQHLEGDVRREIHQKNVREMPKNNYQAFLFEAANPALERIGEALKKIDINTLSPVEALLKLNELKLLLSEK